MFCRTRITSTGGQSLERRRWRHCWQIPFVLCFSGVFGSGLCVLSKYPIVSTLFHAWSVNGYVHRIQHGDWFGGKGVGLCQILANGYPVNIYIAHVRAMLQFLTISGLQMIISIFFPKASRRIRSREWRLQCASCSAGIRHSTIYSIDAWRFGPTSLGRRFKYRTRRFGVQVIRLNGIAIESDIFKWWLISSTQSTVGSIASQRNLSRASSWRNCYKWMRTQYIYSAEHKKVIAQRQTYRLHFVSKWHKYRSKSAGLHITATRIHTK